ncbi:DUF362 domain-containing protein, partial [Spirochaetota bacterium]
EVVMEKKKVSIVKYKENDNSVSKAVELSGAFNGLSGNEKVLIKPNIVMWTKSGVFPKWGVITTSTVIEEIVKTLMDYGIKHITIGEGIMGPTSGQSEVPGLAYENLGYNKLKERYGVRLIDFFDSPYEEVHIDNGIKLKVNRDTLNSDFIVNVPVLKTHAQAKVSLGIKNIKGTLDISSRKKCHSPDHDKDLNYMISQLHGILPPWCTIIDGIYSLERGPAPNGRARRTNLIIASSDFLSADLVGARLLGYNPSDVKSLVYTAENMGRPLDLSDVEIAGEKIEDVQSFHEYSIPYNEDETMPLSLEKRGLKGISYRKHDPTLCTYCTFIYGSIMAAILFAWKGEPWDNVEVLSGKIMKSRGGFNKTILLGKCMCDLNMDCDRINEVIPVKGCPPKPEDAVKALHKAGIEIAPEILTNIEGGMGFLMMKYKDKPEFDESFYGII